MNCTRCRKVPPRPGGKTCQGCYEYLLQLNRDHRRRSGIVESGQGGWQTPLDNARSRAKARKGTMSAAKRDYERHHDSQSPDPEVEDQGLRMHEDAVNWLEEEPIPFKLTERATKLLEFSTAAES